MNQPYEQYKDSNINWLGVIPSHWSVKKLKAVANVVLGKMLTPEDKGDYSLRPYLKSKNIGWGKLLLDNTDEMWFSNKELKTYRVKKDDLLVSEGGEVGKTAIWNDELFECYIQNSVHKVTLLEEYWPRFFLYYFNFLGHSGYFKEVVSQVSIAHLTREKLVISPCVTPPLAEQRVIANYLDRKTAQLDALVARKEELLNLLQKKRQAIINEAVTQGLDANAHRKDSGIDWLGEIPAHWNVKKLRYEIDFLTDYTANGSFADLAKNVEYLEEGYSRLVRLTDLRENLRNAGLYVSEAAHKYLSKSELFGGEILLANVGAYSGLAWKMPFIESKATLAPNMFMLRFKSTLDENFAYYALTADYLHGQLKNKAVSSAQPKLNKEDVRSTILILPPLEEQRLIVEYIRKVTIKINQAVSDIKVQLIQLKTYRQSLISEIVTGKIDVRNKVPAEL